MLNTIINCFAWENSEDSTVPRTNDREDLASKETITCWFRCVYIVHACSCFPAAWISCCSEGMEMASLLCGSCGVSSTLICQQSTCRILRGRTRKVSPQCVSACDWSQLWNARRTVHRHHICMVFHPCGCAHVISNHRPVQKFFYKLCTRMVSPQCVYAYGPWEMRLAHIILNRFGTDVFAGVSFSMGHLR